MKFKSHIFTQFLHTHIHIHTNLMNVNALTTK